MIFINFMLSFKKDSNLTFFLTFLFNVKKKIPNSIIKLKYGHFLIFVPLTWIAL
jgi:hypothetical protein